MRIRHTFQVWASVGEVAAFHTTAANMIAITPPLIPMRLRRAPAALAEGDGIPFTMWLGLPMLFAHCGWKTRGLLENGA